MTEPRFPDAERGAALLSVLLLVAILAVLAAAAVDRLRLATALASNVSGQAQARTYGYAAEALAMRRIGDLIHQDAARTTLAGDWNGVERRFPIDRGVAAATIDDAGNCFNLNSLVMGQAATGLTARPQAMAQFTRLMVLLGIPANNAGQVAAAAADWIDSDSAPLPGGAEDDLYLSLKPAYRTANTLMADMSELRAVAGVTPEIYTIVRPYVCALPTTDLSPVNVNTISERQAVLLAMLSPALEPAAAARAIAARPTTGWADITTFRQSPALAALGDAAGQLQVTSRWFGLKLRVTDGDAEYEENALIDGALKPAKLVRRGYGEAT
ncbi:Type II secretion system protein K [Sphingomonas antarctica]|uniref:type II secretion system minor pseudopilin GspK n=1 Tax=Sphingomonas antarctica TaxID=2040274 RepID=UPI0039E82841